jgi:hypothetical protein
MHRIRNSIPPIYGILILAGFLVSAKVGVIVIIVGGALSGVLWSSARGGRTAWGGIGRDRSARAQPSEVM